MPADKMQKVSMQPNIQHGGIPTPGTVMWNTRLNIQLLLIFMRKCWIVTCLYSVYFPLYLILMFWNICFRLNYLPWKLNSSISHISHRLCLKLFTTAKSSKIRRHLCMCEITMKQSLMSRRLDKDWQTMCTVRYSNSQAVLIDFSSRECLSFAPTPSLIQNIPCFTVTTYTAVHGHIYEKTESKIPE